MPEPRFRSRTYKRVHKRLPGGKTALKHELRKPEVHKCANCKKPIKGIPRERPTKMKNMPLSKKTVARAFGGYLCSACSRELIKKQSR